MNVQDEPVFKETVEVSHWMMRFWLLLIFWLGEKPVHLDEANFLAMTRGDFWAPHLIQINWEGQDQTAFDVLSNPPGMVWLLVGQRTFDRLDALVGFTLEYSFDLGVMSLYKIQ